MRIEQQNKNVYVKKVDKVENYIINAINRFLETEIDKISASREAIILEVTSRVKEYLNASSEELVKEEILKLINNEFDLFFKQKIADTILEIFNGDFPLPIIQYKYYDITISSTTNIILVTDLIKLGINDLLEVFINGIIHRDFEINTNVDGYITDITLPSEDILLYGDTITLKTTITVMPEVPVPEGE